MDAAVAVPRAIDLGTEHPFRVGGAAIDPASRDAAFNGSTERLQPQNLKVLVALARNRGKVVTRDELVDLCWEGRFVGDDVINRAISTLRQFAERAGGFTIETVPRAGYRLVETSPQKRPGWRRWPLVAAIALVALGLAAWVAWQRTNNAVPERTPVIALLPFTTASTDAATRQLATAAHDSVAHTLSQTQFHVTLADSAGNALRSGADFVISGDINSASGQTIAMVRMEETAHQTIVYSHRFEAPSAVSGSLIDQVGGQVAGTIGWTVPLLMFARDDDRSDPSITAQLFRKDDFQEVDELGLYEAARRFAAQAPDSVNAQIQLAFSTAFALSEIPRNQRREAAAAARLASDRARALAPRFGEPFSTWCLLRSSVRLADCEDHLREGMRVDPDSPFVDLFLGSLLNDTGRTQDALDLAKHSLAHDPYVVTKIAFMLRMYERAGDSAAADALSRQASRWWPRNEDFVGARISGMIDAGNYEGIEQFEKRIGKASLPSWYEPLAPIASAGRANSVAGVRRYCPLPGTDTLKSLFCISALARVGELDDAFAIATKLYPRRVGRTAPEEDEIWLDKPFVNGTEYFTGAGAAPLRRDPRYLQLAERVGLLRYWRSGRVPDFCTRAHEPVCRQILR